MTFQETRLRIAFIAAAFVAAAPLAQAQGNGDHPALIARRVIAAQGYDYASAFYRHPAGLSLGARAPEPAQDARSAAKPEPAGDRAALRAATQK